MVRSRKYALITAALALILIAAVVLTVVLTGNGTYYDRAPEGSVSDAEVGISPTTGTVDNREEYLVTTLLKNSSIGNIANLTAENMQDLRNSNGDVYVAGAAKDGINDTYVIKLNPGVRLLTNDGWTTVDRGDLNTDTTYGGSGVFDVKYNGIWYRFENGTTGKPENENGVNYNSLYQTFNNFLTKKGFYQQSYNYGLIVEPTGVVYYNPNDTSMLSWFDATLDGAGATIKPTAVLNFTWGNKYGTSWAHEVKDYEAGHDKDSAYKIDRGVQYIRNNYMGGNLTRNTEGGIGFVGLLFGAMRYGSFRNFIWSDDVEGLSGDHYFHYGSKKSGTAFGGLVGLAGPSDNEVSGARSSIYNVQMDFNHNLDHRMGFGNHGYDKLADTRCDIYSGGLLGINLNADVELVDINYNGIQFSQYALRGQNHSYSSSEKGEWGQSSFGGVIGAQSNVYRKDMTISKITVTGLKSATMFASATVEKEWGDGWSGPSRYNNIYTMIGGIIGGLYGNIDIKGVIFDMNYDKIFNMWHGGPGGARDDTTWQRGILVGHIFSSQFSTSDIYVTNKIFGADSYTGDPPTISAIGSNKDYSMTVSPFGNYTTKYSYIGGVDENNSYTDTYKRFVYLEDTVVSSVSFTDDTYTEYVNGEPTTKEYMLQISAPVDKQGVKKQGVMWDITYNVDKGSASNNHEYLYMQNLQDNVNLKGVSNISLTDQTAYMTMSIQYASSYNFELVNGHNDTGESTKVYNGERVNYATLDLKAQSSDTVIEGNYQPTYVQIGLDGNVTFHNNSGGTLTGTDMKNFRTSGNEQSSDFAKLASSLFQLEFATNVEEELFNVAENWDAQVDVNTYRWSSLGLFAVETGDGKFVFAPETGTQAEIEITHRPISLNLLNPKAPYIGEAYSLEYNPKGGNYASVIDGKVHYNFTSSVDDKGGLIGTDVVSFIPSGGSFTARDAGSYVLNGELSGADSGNYQYSVGNSFTIEPAQAVITINGGSMVYGTRPTQAELAGMVNYSVSFKNTGTYLSSGFAAADGITPSFNMQTSLDTATSAGWMFAKAGASVFNNNFPADEYDVVVDALTGTGLKNYVVSEVVVGTQFSVTPRPLTSTLPAVNGFIYGDAVAPTVGTPVFAGWASGDSRGAFEIRYYLSGTPAEYTYDVRFGAGTYYVRAVPTAVNAPGSANGMNNYKVSYNDPLFEVEKRDTYVNFTYDPSLTYTYKAEPYDFEDFEALALSNGAGGDTVDDVLFAAYSDPERKNQADALNAGTYYPGATSETLSANYNILGVRDKNGNEWATFVIGRATVSLSLDKLTLVYNGAARDFDLKNVTISSDVESLQAELGGLKEKLVFLFNNSSVKPQDAATYNVTVNLPQQPNYNAATASLTGGLVIEQLGIVINASDKTDTYNGAVIPEIGFTVTAAPGADVSSLPEGWADKLAISVAYEKDGSPVTSLRNVGTYSVTYTYDGNTGNFKSASKTITYKVDPKSLDFVLKNANVTYNKQAYVPDYDLTGAVIGDTVNAVLSASKNGVPVETIVDAGTYDITVSLVDGTGAPAGNYTVAADGLQVVVAPYEIIAREINTTLFFNSGALGAAYYEGQMKYTVIDADGKDITGEVTVTPDLINLKNDDSVVNVDPRGGAYRASLTLKLPADYVTDNYSVQTNVYNVYIYRIALRAVLSKGSVTFGDEYNVKGQLYAMAGDDEEQTFTVGADGVVTGFKLSGVTGLTVTSASMTISGSDLGGNAVDGTLSGGIDAIFNSGIYDAAKMANAGTYTATIEVTLNAEYNEPSLNRPVTLSAPFTWTVDPYEIKVTPGQLDTYYTEPITVDDIMREVVFEGEDERDEKSKSFVTAVSAAIGDGESYVNAGEYDYDLVLNTTKPGYFNYTLPDVTTGKINVQQLTVQVSAADATVEYGNAVTLSSAEVRIFKGDQDVTEDVAGLKLSAQYPYSLITEYEIGDPVNDYVIAAQPGSVTENFAFLPVDGTLKVTQRSIGIKLDNIEMEYGTASLPEITFTLESGSLYGSDVVTLETSSLKITAGSSAEEVVAESDYDRIDANTYSYTFENITLSDDNYVLTAKTSGVLTVTPYQIASVEWSDPAAALTYRGEAFLPGEMHTIAAQTMPNGDVVTFGVNYGGEVRSAGIYTAIATVASVKNGEEDVVAGNYDVSRVATRSLTVGRASLTLAGVDNAGTMSVENVYNASAQALDPSRLVFTFGDATYDADRDGALGLTLSYAQGGVSATPEHAGSYDVTVVLSSSNANFTPASFSGVSFVITRWELSAEEFKGNVSVNIPENLKYTSSAQGATLSFTNILADENIAYTLKYYVLGEEGAMATDPSEPVNAASYAVKVTIDTADVYYVSAESEGTLVIAPNDSIDLNGFVIADAGAVENAKYYTGGPLYPNVEATISGLRGEAAEIIVTDNSAFKFTFFVKDENGEKMSFANSTVKVADLGGQSTAVKPDYYYVRVTFNPGGKFDPNYAADITLDLVEVEDGSPLVFQITKGSMLIRVNSGSTAEYNGLSGFNGRDVIYKEGELWRINTEIITFVGVDLASMIDLISELKVGDITIDVAVYYGNHKGTGIPLYSTLYTWEWLRSGGEEEEDDRSEPTKTVYTKPIREDVQLTTDKVANVQTKGPVNGIYDFGYSDGLSTATYLISVSVDNTVDGSEYSPAQSVKYDENGDIVTDSNNKPVPDYGPHTASGSVNIAPAETQFELFYTSDFYQSGANMLEGGYKELNELMEKADGVPVELSDEWLSGAHFYIRGVQIAPEAFANAPDLDDKTAVGTDGAYMVSNAGVSGIIGGNGYGGNVESANYSVGGYYYERISTQWLHITITDSEGNVVYTDDGGSQNGGITDAGTYRISITFDGMPGKYSAYSYSCDFVQQKAEYHIVVSETAGANLTVEFGTEFDVSGLQDQLEIELETGENAVVTGSYDAFVTAFENFKGGDQSALNGFIKLVGTSGGGATEYSGYKTPVGDYYIYYVYESVNDNLEVIMETSDSRIVVTPAAPELLLKTDGSSEYVADEKIIADSAYRAGYDWTDDLLSQVMLGLKYKNTEGEPVGEYYASNALAVSEVQYRVSAESGWGMLTGSSIGAVGQYRISFVSTDDNLVGEAPYSLTFTVTKISATAYIINIDELNGQQYTGAQFALDSFFEVRDDATGEVVPAAALAGTPEFNIYTQFDEDANDGAGGPVESSKVEFVRDAGTYYIAVSVTGSANYNVTPSQFVTITIEKADLRVRFAGESYSAVYNRASGNTVGSIYTYELNGRSITPSGVTEIYYLRGAADQTAVQEFVAAYLAALEGNETLTITQWLEENAETYAGYEFTSVNGTNAATDVGTYYPIVVYGGDTNFNKSARLIDNGVYPEFVITPAALRVEMVYNVNYEITYGDSIDDDITGNDVVSQYATLLWNEQVGVGSDGQPVYSTIGNIDDFSAATGANIALSLIDRNVYAAGNAAGTYSSAFQLNVELTYDEGEYNNFELIYTPDFLDLTVAKKSVIVDIGDVAVALGTLGQQTLVEGGVKFNGVYNGSSFGTLELVVGDGFVFGIKGEGYDDTVVDADSGKYGVLTVTMSGTLAEGGAMIAGSYSSSVDFALNNANYTIDLYDGTSKLTTLGSIDGTPYSVHVSLDVAKAVLRVDFDELKYKWLDETFTESVDAGSGEHQGWWEYATMYTGRNFRRNERLLIQSGYYNGSKWVPYGVYAQQVKLGDIINATELGIVVTDGASGMLADAGEYSFHLVISSTNYEFERADKSRSSAIDVNITISPSEALEVNLNLDPEGADADLFTKNGEVWEREFDGMTITTRTIMGEYLKVYRYEIPQGANALTGEVTLKKTSLGDVTDGVFAQGVNVTLAGDNAVGGSIIYAGDYDLIVNVNMDNMAERTEVAKLKITPAKQGSVTTEITNRSKSGMTYNGSSIVPSFDFKITVKEALSDVTHTQKVNSYSVRVSRDGEALFTYAVEGGVVNMTDEQRAMLANAGVYTFELIVDSATMPNLEDGATFAFSGAITIEARPITDSSIRWSYRESFDFKSANGEAVAVTKEGINFIAYYNRDTLLEEGTDYELTFNGEAGKYTGEYTFTVTGKGNFTSTSTSTITGTYYIGASVGPTEAPAALTYGADNKITVKLAVNSLAPGSADIINDIHLAFDDSARLVTEGGTTVSQLRLESISPEGGNFIAVFGGVGAVNAGTYYLSLSFSCEYEYEEGKVIGSGGEINTDVSGSEVCKVVVQPASAAAVADSVNVVLTAVNSNNLSFVIDGKANGYEYSIDGETWVKAYKGENTVTGLTPETKYTVKFRLNDSNYAEGGVTEYPLAVQLTDVYTTMNVDNILADAQDLAGNFNMTGFGRYVELMDDLNSVSVADREARAEEIEEALAAIEEARSEYMADLQAAIDSAVDTAEKATGKGIGVSAVGTAAVVGGAAMPAALGIGFIFAAARKRKSKEEDLND